MKSSILSFRPARTRRSARSSLRMSPFLHLSSHSYYKSSPSLSVPIQTRAQPFDKSISSLKVPYIPRRRYFCLRDSESLYDIRGKSVVGEMVEASGWRENKAERQEIGLRRVSKQLENRLETIASDRRRLERVSLEPASSLPARIQVFQELKRGNNHAVRKLVLEHPELIRAVDAVKSLHRRRRRCCTGPASAVMWIWRSSC